jgi:hypothetical protein
MKSPEALADAAAEETLSAYFDPNPRYRNWEPWRGELGDPVPGQISKLLQHQENIFYGMEDARRDLNFKPRGKKS